MKNLEIIRCSKEFWEFVRFLRTHPDTQNGFIQSSSISEIDQIEYMNKNHMNYRICLLDKKPVGYFGVINDDIRICTHPDYQNKGIGLYMLNELNKIWPNAIAKIKAENISSIKLFEKAGFKKTFVFYENNVS